MSILKFKEANCKNCYKCIRNCPIKAIELKNDQAQIIEKECVLCGSCVLVCPQNAKQVRNDVHKVIDLIETGQQVIASLAPSFIAEFGVSGIEEFSGYLKQLGFAGAYETAEGAYVVKTEYEKLVDEKWNKVIISSCCPTVLNLIQKYHPAVIGNVAPVISPMQAHAKILRERFPDAHIVFIGPCISKKGEVEQYDSDIDVVLTFEELNEWFGKNNIEIPRNNEVDREKYLSRFFPVSGGILKTMRKNDDYHYMVVDGMDNCVDAIREIENENLQNCFIEMSACVGSCINGPSFRKQGDSRILSQIRVADYAKKEGQHQDYDLEYHFETGKQIKDEYIALQLPSEEKIREIMKKMGKTKPEDELNCGTCGYPTCYEKAIAVYFGKAEISMCLPYMKEKAESFSDEIISSTPNAILTVDSNYHIQQINDAACKLFHIGNPKDVIGREVSVVMDISTFADVFDTGKNITNQKVYMAEYNMYVEQIFVFDSKSSAVICIMKDITQQVEENEKMMQLKNNAAEIADKVIEKQMRVVQEIASLLGETTAETKIALTKMKNTVLMDEEK